MRRMVVIASLVACGGSASPRAPVERGRDSPPAAGDAREPRSAGPANQRFPEAEVRAFHKCTASAPPTVSLLLSGGKDPDWIQIDLAHGPADRLPRTFESGTTASIGGCCGPKNQHPDGRVTLQTLTVGESATGHYRLVVPNGILEDRFEAAWKEKPWAVQPCPGPPDAYPP